MRRDGIDLIFRVRLRHQPGEFVKLINAEVLL
jgi:hypothetical protein